MKLQRLKTKGVHDLKKELLRIRNEEYPNLDISKFGTEPVKDIEIESTKKFTSKLELGKYFLQLFDCIDVDVDARMWNWIFLIYYNQFLNTRGKIGEVKRVFYSINETYSHTHVLGFGL